MAGDSKGAAGQGAGFWLLWRYVLVDRFAVRSSNPCRHGRACPGHPRRAAARTSPASARPAGRRTVARLFALACALAVVGKESGAWRRWRTAPSRRHGRACPGHPRRPSASTIRARLFALIALAVVGKESGAWRRWRTAPSRRHGRACPGHPRRPSASTQASAKSLATVRLPAGRAEAGLVLAAARRGWPGQARP